MPRTISNMGPPFSIKLLDKACPTNPARRLTLYRLAVLVMTFVAYTCYHMSRKPISVVKTRLLNCTGDEGSDYANAGHGNIVIPGSEPEHKRNESICTSFISEINGTTQDEGKRLEGTLDTAYLFSYAFFMFVSGFVAERVDLRFFLSAGMVLSGIFTMLFGFAYYWGFHHISYFLFVQIFGGAFQTTGWPGVVTIVANWFGHGKKGLIMGIWNSHTSIGNILGSLLAGAYVDINWGLSFIVPGFIMTTVGAFFWFTLVTRPEDVGLSLDAATAYRVASPPPTSRQSGGRRRRNSLPIESAPLLDPEDENTVEVLVAEEQERPLDARVAGRTYQTVDKRRSPNGGHRRTDSLESGVSSSSSSDSLNEVAVVATNNADNSIPAGAAVVLVEREQPPQAVSFLGALKIPGVVEFSFCLFFSKLVSYTFLYWLPSFIKETGVDVSSEHAAYLSTLFDVGGIVGGIAAGLITDYTGKPASTCAVMLVAAIPMLFTYQAYGHNCPLVWDESHGCYSGHVGLLMALGLLVNGPYALITTAVSAELGQHPCLQGSSKALATVTSIIDGTGSIGAALGPYLAGAIPGFENVFYMLMAADVLALLETKLRKKNQ